MARGRRRIREISESVRIEGRGLWSKNAVRGVAVRNENLKRNRGTEWRHWSPRNSKLAAGILRTKGEPDDLLPDVGASVLYLGAGHGTTVSHLHDHLCGEKNESGGQIVAVDIAPRCLRDLIRLAKVRPGLLPVLADARKPETLSPWLPNRVPWLFQDVSQAGQVDLFLGAAKNFLAPHGLALLSLKSASERVSAGGAEEQYATAAAALADAGLDVLEVIELTGWEEQHALITARAPSDWVR